MYSPLPSGRIALRSIRDSRHHQIQIEYEGERLTRLLDSVGREIRVTSDGPHLVASIRDLASTNGTFVNSERISSQRLSDGDRITVGRTSVIYRGGRR